MNAHKKPNNKANNLKQQIRLMVPNQILNYLYHLPKAILANLVYAFPSHQLRIIGVTGTDGKTTTSTIIHHILSSTGYKSALISSVEAKFDHTRISTGLHITSPGPFKLQKILKQAIQKKCRYLVLEITSHALDQWRDWGLKYEISVLTNISSDHLDYHQTKDKYLKTKASLLNKSKIAIVNAEDDSFEDVKKLSWKKMISFGLKKGDYTLKDLPIKTKLAGRFNQQNCLAAAVVCLKMGLTKKEILSAIAGFTGVKGRMDLVANKKDLAIVIDFAHTANSLEQALKSLRQISQKRLIAVFGCAGLRDKSKRPKMGQISGQLADISIITAEDPRTEDLSKINSEIESGLKKAGSRKISIPKLTAQDRKVYLLIPDRQEAINFALRIAKPGDLVAIFGKGHEQSMCFGITEHPWSDYTAVKKALKGE